MMPLLQFKCEQEHVTERLVSPFRAPNYQRVVQCDLCQRSATRIIALPAAPQFKGTGFYATDYKGK